MSLARSAAVLACLTDREAPWWVDAMTDGWLDLGEWLRGEGEAVAKWTHESVAEATEALWGADLLPPENDARFFATRRRTCPTCGGRCDADRASARAACRCGNGCAICMGAAGIYGTQRLPCDREDLFTWAAFGALDVATAEALGFAAVRQLTGREPVKVVWRTGAPAVNLGEGPDPPCKVEVDGRVYRRSNPFGFPGGYVYEHAPGDARDTCGAVPELLRMGVQLERIGTNDAGLRLGRIGLAR